MRFTYIKRPKVIKYQQPFGYPSEHTVIFHRNKKNNKNKNKKNYEKK